MYDFIMLIFSIILWVAVMFEIMAIEKKVIHDKKFYYDR